MVHAGLRGRAQTILAASDLVAARKDQATDNTVWVNLDERRFSPGSKVEFTAGARSPQGEPIPDATIEVEVIRPDGW